VSRANPLILAFNRGIMSPRALARVDLKKTMLAAEAMVNWLPRALGSMSLRPGTEHLGVIAGNNTAGVLLPFVFSTSDTALLEVTVGKLRIWSDDVLVSAEVVGTTLTNTDFTSNITGWTVADEAGASSTWLSGAIYKTLSLVGTGTKKAQVYQTVSIAAGDAGKRHTLQVSTLAYSNECVLRVGTTVGGEELVGPITLRPGSHAISFTPSTPGNVYVHLSNRDPHAALVDYVRLADPGPVELTTVWWDETDLHNIRWEQSGDVIFACDGSSRQQRIERWGPASWSVVDYYADDGPFFPVNLTPITLTSSAYAAPPYEVKLTASANTFDPLHVGCLFRLERIGQTATAAITGDDQWSDSIRVTNVENARIFTVVISGKAGGDAGIVTLQRSIGGEGDWFDVATYTADTTVAFDDGLDNNIAYYRIGVKIGEFDTDSFDVTLSYAAGTTTDVIRVTGYNSKTEVYGIVVSSPGGYGTTSTWWEGRWSDLRGWPTSVAIHEGRLWNAGADRINGSVSDAYSSFDDTVEGDSGPISRSIATGPVDVVNWMIGLDRLLIGTGGSEFQVKSSSLDEPLTPSAFTLRAVSTQGSSRVPTVKVDTSAIFVHRNGNRLYEVAPSDNGYGYLTADLAVAAPDIGKPGISRTSVQRQPDTRIYCVRADGKLAVLAYDKAEDVRCWFELETDGDFEEVAVLPGAGGDVVYAIVKRRIGHVDYRFVEKFYPEIEIGRASESRLADCHHHVDGPVSTVTGLDHLEGKTVVIWAEGRDIGTAVVGGGEVALPEELEDITVGLPYTARFKGARLILSDTAPFMAAKQIAHVGLILLDTHAQGLRYGQSFDYLDDLPLKEGYALVDQDAIHATYEEQTIEVNGSWEPDARLCLEAAAPRPCTVVACIVDATGHTK